MFALQEIRGNSKFQKTYPRILQGTPSTFGPTPAGHFISWRRDPHQSLSLTRWDILGGQWNIVLVGCTGSHLGCSTFVEQSSIIANFPMVKNPSFSVVIMSLILGSGQMKNNKTLFWFSLKKTAGTPRATLPTSGSIAALTNVALTPVVAEKPFISMAPWRWIRVEPVILHQLIW